MCVCVCERERERERDRQSECVCVYTCVYACAHSGLAALADRSESLTTVHRDGMNYGVVEMVPILPPFSQRMRADCTDCTI